MVDDWEETSTVHLDGFKPQTVKRAHLVGLRGVLVGRRIRILEPHMVIGRLVGADLLLDDEGVSRMHCKLLHQRTGVVVEDLGSRNGTFCNNERVLGGARQLVEGDRLQIGTTAMFLFTYLEDKRDSFDQGVIPVTDPLTGACTSRYLLTLMVKEVAAALERKTALALLMFHIDRYDDISQRIGPDRTNELVKAVFDRVREKLRPRKDVLARIERGEFAVMAKATSPGDTHMLAERVRSVFNGVAIETLSGEQHEITVSVGVASIHELRIANEQDMFMAASAALFRARTQGGNRVVPCTQDLQERSRRSSV